MINNKQRYEINRQGVIINRAGTSVRALSDYTTTIEVVAPFPRETSVMANFLVYDSRDINLSLFLSPVNKKGHEVSNNPDVADWNVWEVELDETILSAISTYQAGRIGVGFTFRASITSNKALNYKGVFNQVLHLPEEGIEVGDFYVCKDYNVNEKGTQYTYNDNAIWDGEKWYKDTNKRVIGTVPTTNLPVDPALIANIPKVPKQDIEQIVATWGAAFVKTQNFATDIEDLQNEKVDRAGDTMTGDLYMNQNQVKNTGRGTDEKDVVIKEQLDEVIDETVRLDTVKANKDEVYSIEEADGLLAKKLNVDPDGSAKVNMPDPVMNRSVVNVAYLLQELLRESNIVDNKLTLKVDKLTKIAGLAIGEGIAMDDLVDRLRTATEQDKGLMSNVDKTRLDTLYELLTEDKEEWVDTIHEIMEILKQYPEGTNLNEILHDLREDITTLENANFIKTINEIEPDENGHIVITAQNILNISAITALNNKDVSAAIDILWAKFDDYYLKGETYSDEQIDAKLDNLKAVYGWESSHIGNFETNNDSFSNILHYNYLVLSASVGGEYLSRLVNTETIKPNDTFILGGLTLTASSADNGTLTFTSGSGTVALYGVKMEQQLAENINYRNTTVKKELDYHRGIGETFILRNQAGRVIRVVSDQVVSDFKRIHGKVVEVEEVYDGGEKYKTLIERENQKVTKIKKEKVN